MKRDSSFILPPSSLPFLLPRPDTRTLLPSARAHDLPPSRQEHRWNGFHGKYVEMDHTGANARRMQSRARYWRGRLRASHDDPVARSSQVCKNSIGTGTGPDQARDADTPTGDDASARPPCCSVIRQTFRQTREDVRAQSDKGAARRRHQSQADSTRAVIPRSLTT